MKVAAGPPSSAKMAVFEAQMARYPNAVTAAADRPLSYVVIEGCIGVGKTTLTELFAGRLGARTVVEVVEENPFLPDFYKDQKAHAFKTQMFFLLSRFKQQEQIVQTDLFARAVVADYMFAKDRIFAELTLTGSEMQLYDQVYFALLNTIRPPDVVVHLKAPLSVILERIQRRGREFERDIDPVYLEKLVDAYGRFFESYTASPVLTVDTSDLNFPGSEEDTDAVLEAARSVARGSTARHLTRGESRQPTLV